MFNSIFIELENCDNVFKSKNSKNNLKKYIKKLLNNLSDDDYIKTLDNHVNDFRKYFNQSLQLNFKLKENNIYIFAKKLSDRDINKIKLKNKLKNLENKNNYLGNKKLAEKKFNEEKKQLKNDSRVTPLMKQLYYKAKYEMPDADIKNPLEILDNIEKYKILFNNYLKTANEKIDIERYILLNNEYCIYMSLMTNIKLEIPDDLESRYKTNNMNF